MDILILSFIAACICFYIAYRHRKNGFDFMYFAVVGMVFIAIGVKEVW